MAMAKIAFRSLPFQSPDALALLSGSLCASFKDVEHPCQQCGTTVEDGRPFCPQCRAPQIHVQVAVPDAGVPAGLNPAPDEFLRRSLKPGNSMGAKPGAGMMAGIMAGMDRGIAVRAALKAGVLGVFIGIIPILLGSC
jgi:hypothetical protein